MVYYNLNIYFPNHIKSSIKGGPPEGSYGWTKRFPEAVLGIDKKRSSRLETILSIYIKRASWFW